MQSKDKPKCMWTDECPFKDKNGFCDWDDTCNQQGFPYACNRNGRLTVIYISRQQIILDALKLAERDVTI
jgi:hypothetical protein